MANILPFYSWGTFMANIISSFNISDGLVVGNLSVLANGDISTNNISVVGNLHVNGNAVTSSGGSSVTVVDDVSTNATVYPIFTNSITGVVSNVNTSSSKLTFNPNTGTLFATQVATSSDISLKNNIYVIDNPFSVIDNISGIGYNWNATGEKSYGVSAQELEKIIPELVKTDGIGEKSVLYTPIIAFLIEAIKHLKKEIDILKSSFM